MEAARPFEVYASQHRCEVSSTYTSI